jgi:hypothetical protein
LTLTTTNASKDYTALPDEQTLAETVVALEEHGFSVEVVDDLDAARETVLARIPDGSSVMTNTSVTLDETGIADAINGGGPYNSSRNRMLASYAWGAAKVIFVVGAQKLVPSPEAARERIVEHSLKLEDARAYAAYGQNSFVGKVLEIHQEPPGRIHVTLIRQSVGF